MSIKTVFILSFMFFGVVITSGAAAKDALFNPTEIPESFKKITALSRLKPFLSSPVEHEKRAAIRRLGQLDDKNAVKILMEVFEKEPYRAEFEVKPAVKLEIINALKENGSNEAKFYLIDILKKYFKNGPVVEEKKYFWKDGDYLHVVYETLDAIYRWKNDDDVYNLYEQIALDENALLRDKAYEMYLRAKMNKNDIKTLEKEIDYLMNELKGEGNTFTTEGIRNIAIIRLLSSYEPGALPYLDKKLNEIPITDPRYNPLSNQIIKFIKNKEKSGLTDLQQK